MFSQRKIAGWNSYILTAVPFVSIPHTRSPSALCTYAGFDNVDIMENTLNLGVTHEHLDVLPGQIVRYVVGQAFTHPGVADGKRQYVCRLECYQWPICLLWLASSLVMSRVTGQTYLSSSNIQSPLFEAK